MNSRKEIKIQAFGCSMENSSERFIMFGNILKMLFSNKIFTFSQLPNKFYIKKSTSTHWKSITIHTKPTTTQQKKPPKHHHLQQQQKNQRSQRERLRDWGKERSVFNGDDGLQRRRRDRSWVGRERDRSWVVTKRTRCKAPI